MSEQKFPIHIRIRDLRRQHSLTQEELAEALGISRQSINAMEAGRNLPSLPMALQIAAYFSVPLTAVLVVDEELFEPLRPLKPTQDLHPMIPGSSWSPLQEAIDDFIEGARALPQPSSAMPAANVYQTQEDVWVEVYLPGYTKNDISLEVGDDFVALSGEMSEESHGREYVRREFGAQAFSRSISLPALVRGEEAKADLRHGVLRIRIPKVIEEKPKTSRIRIDSEE